MRNALERSSLVTETKKLKKHVSQKYRMVGESAALEEVRNMIARVAPTTARALITGENAQAKSW
ncbi:MAG: hypothetical protein U5L09_07790 [Bacteroidales bacterium]|nr:hypothetical protein [Bacteroidales bacterium]